MPPRTKPSVYAARYELAPGRTGYVIVRRRDLTRVDVPSDWLLALAPSIPSQNTLKSLAESVAQWWCWCEESGVDPLSANVVDFARFVTALQTIPRTYALTSPVRALPGDPRLRKATTVRLRVINLKSFYGWAQTDSRVRLATSRAICAFRTPTAPQAMRASRLSPSQVEVLLSGQYHPRDRYAIELLYGTGLREGEAIGLHVEDLCLSREIAEVFDCTIPEVAGPHAHVRRRMNSNGALAKSHYERVVPLPQRVVIANRNWQAWAFEHLPQSLESAFVFVSLAGRTKGQPLSMNGFNSMWTNHVKTVLGLDWVTPHILRHTYASELIDAGVPEFTVQQLLGHRSPTSTQVYTHAQMSTLIGAVNKLAEWRTSRVGIAS